MQRINMMQIKDLKPYDQIVLENDQPKVDFRTVDKLVPSNLPDWVFIYLVGKSTPELLRCEQVLSPKNSVWLKEQP
jgi:hypothetical protein